MKASIVLVLAISCLGYALGRLIMFGMGAVTWSLIFGVLAINLLPRRWSLDDRVRKFALGWLLKGAIIGLGAGLDIREVDLRGSTLLLIGGVVLVGFATAKLTAHRLQLDSSLGTLLGMGVAICGASAIAVTAPIVKARDEDIGIAVGAVFALNAASLLLLPWIGHLTGVDAGMFGVVAGLGVHDTATAVATGAAFGPEAGEVATLFKLTRTLFLIPAVLGLLAFSRREDRGLRRAESVAESTTVRVALSRSLPWFVVGFVLMAALNNAGLLGGTSDMLRGVANALIIVVVASVGLTLRVDTIMRAGIGRALLAIAVATLCIHALIAIGLAFTI